jgi:dipeptidyl aminopeptidase/acylaminoacyl peptidase
VRPAWTLTPYAILVAFNERGGWDPTGRYLATWGTHPSWSPDGRRIVYCSDPGCDGRLHIVRVDARTNRILQGGSSADPAWSPDGKLIAFGRLNDPCTLDDDLKEICPASAPVHHPRDGGKSTTGNRERGGERFVVTGRQIHRVRPLSPHRDRQLQRRQATLHRDRQRSSLLA